MLIDGSMQSRILGYLVIGLSILIGFVLLFAASAIFLRIKNHQRAVKWNALESVWEPLIMEVLYGGDEASRLWKVVDRKDRMFFLDLLLRYARRLAGEERAHLAALAEPYLPLVVTHLDRGGAERRARAVHMLGELGMPQYADEIVRALDDESALVAMTAARSLARRSHPQYAAAVMNHLHRFLHWRPSFLAAMLSSMGPEAAPAIRETFADRNRASGVRAVAAIALGQLNDARSASIAAEMVKTDPDREVVASSLRLLAKVGRPEDLHLVRSRLGADDEIVRGAAAAALGNLGDPLDLEPLREAAVEDASRWVAISAARSLRNLGGIRTLRELASSGHARASLALQILSESS